MVLTSTLLNSNSIGGLPVEEWVNQAAVIAGVASVNEEFDYELSSNIMEEYELGRQLAIIARTDFGLYNFFDMYALVDNTELKAYPVMIKVAEKLLETFGRLAQR